MCNSGCRESEGDGRRRRRLGSDILFASALNSGRFDVTVPPHSCSQVPCPGESVSVEVVLPTSRGPGGEGNANTTTCAKRRRPLPGRGRERSRRDPRERRQHGWPFRGESPSGPRRALAELFSQEIDAAKSELRVNKREADEPDVYSPLIWASPGAPFPAPWAPALVSLVPGKAQQGLRVRIDRRSAT